jgi:hypothetical protein
MQLFVHFAHGDIRFEDIIVHDGSSFALKEVLWAVFPGRFTTIDPVLQEDIIERTEHRV